MKKIMRILLLIVILLVTLLAGFKLYVDINYSHIRKDIRLMGVISDLMVQFDDEKSLRKVSENFIYFPTKLSDEIILEEVWIETSDKDKIRTIIMKPSIQTEITNAVLWMHGGGLAMGTPESELSIMQKFVEYNGAVVISPDYTHSIDEPYPAAIDDCYATLLWIKENASDIGIDEEQIFVGGGSAGGGLAASLSLMARDKGEVNIAFQMPLYPMIDNTTIPNKEEKSNTLLWDLERNEIVWKVYLGEYYGTKNIPSYAVPMLAESFENLPPTYTFVGSEDPFYTDTLEYVHKLKDAGVIVEFDVHENVFHGFDMIPNADSATQAWDKLFEQYDYAVKNYRTPQP
ncbi:hypothetical protein AN644_02455 [Candidatus Epulonipiscium fishelsonii]|nr:hypothetical protein AN644_02455 [Epulopiscium sp. SCG-C06WGA-EpuloA1]